MSSGTKMKPTSCWRTVSSDRIRSETDRIRPEAEQSKRAEPLIAGPPVFASFVLPHSIAFSDSVMEIRSIRPSMSRLTASVNASTVSTLYR